MQWQALRVRDGKAPQAAARPRLRQPAHLMLVASKQCSVSCLQAACLAGVHAAAAVEQAGKQEQLFSKPHCSHSGWLLSAALLQIHTMVMA